MKTFTFGIKSGQVRENGKLLGPFDKGQRYRLFGNLIPTVEIPICTHFDELYTVYTIGLSQAVNRFGFHTLTSNDMLVSSLAPEFILSGNDSTSSIFDVEGLCYVSGGDGGETYAYLQERTNVHKDSVTSTFKYATFVNPSANADFVSFPTTWNPRTITTNVPPFTANKGPEGITWNPDNGLFYIAFEGNPAIFPNDSSYGIYTIDPADDTSLTKSMPLTHLMSSTTVNLSDLSDIHYDRYLTNNLFVLSDQSGAIVQCTVDGTLVEKVTAVEWLSDTQGGDAQSEGIAFSRDMCRMYVSSEPDIIWLYSRPATSPIVLSSYTYVTSAALDYMLESDLSSITI